MRRLNSFAGLLSTLALTILGGAGAANADIVTDWNLKARDIVVEGMLPTPHSNRALAIVHTAAFEALNAITHEFPGSLDLGASPEASTDAAIASATRHALLYLLPAQQDTIDAVYTEALTHIPDGPDKVAGIEIGQRAAITVWSVRENDGSASPEAYRPHTTAGNYVPTTIPAVPHWVARQPWMLSEPAQFRPVGPPALTSETWSRDFAEVKAIGESESSHRSVEQTQIAKFWEATLPPIYHGVVHSVANMPGRSVTENARLFAAVTRATDDAMIAVFEAKYHYGFWRPITAIRNADIDDNDSTQRDASWSPYIPTPMHPEYPCAHCVIAGTVGAILKAEIGCDVAPELTTTSYTADGATRRWSSVDGFVREVSEARIYDGVHYRTSTEVGTDMGIQIGNLAVETYLSPEDLSCASATTVR